MVVFIFYNDSVYHKHLTIFLTVATTNVHEHSGAYKLVCLDWKNSFYISQISCNFQVMLQKIKIFNIESCETSTVNSEHLAESLSKFTHCYLINRLGRF